MYLRIGRVGGGIRYFRPRAAAAGERINPRKD